MTISEWLSANVDSHGIYSVTLLESLPEPVRYQRETDRLERYKTGTKGKPIVIDSLALYAKSVGDYEKYESQSVVGPKGAEPFDESVDREEVCFSGYILSAALDRLMTGENAGGQFFGRGTSHRACIAHLKEKGF